MVGIEGIKQPQPMENHLPAGAVGTIYKNHRMENRYWNDATELTVALLRK
jgi:hypothetical protein